MIDLITSDAETLRKLSKEDTDSLSDQVDSDDEDIRESSQGNLMLKLQSFTPYGLESSPAVRARLRNDEDELEESEYKLI